MTIYHRLSGFACRLSRPDSIIVCLDWQDQRMVLEIFTTVGIIENVEWLVWYCQPLTINGSFSVMCVHLCYGILLQFPLMSTRF